MSCICMLYVHTSVFLREIGENTHLFVRAGEVLGGEVGRQEGAVWIEQVPPLAHHCHTEQHIHTAQEEVVRVDQVVVDLRILACRG